MSLLLLCVVFDERIQPLRGIIRFVVLDLFWHELHQKFQVCEQLRSFIHFESFQALCVHMGEHALHVLLLDVYVVLG